MTHRAGRWQTFAIHQTGAAEMDSVHELGLTEIDAFDPGAAQVGAVQVGARHLRVEQTPGGLTVRCGDLGANQLRMA